METSNNQSFLSEFSEPNFCVYKCSKFAVLASGYDKLGKPCKYRATYCNASPGKSSLIWKLQICTTESRNTEIHQERLITKTVKRATSYWPNTEKSRSANGNTHSWSFYSHRCWLLSANPCASMGWEQVLGEIRLRTNKTLYNERATYTFTVAARFDT